jgi:hypothetical protein
MPTLTFERRLEAVVLGPGLPGQVKVTLGRQFSVVAPSKPSVLNDSAHSSKEYKEDVKKYEENLNGGNAPSTARRLRDKIVYGLMGEIDDGYGNFTRNLYTGKGAFGVGADSTQLGLTAAATIATHAPTKTLLSALATAFTGVNLSIDKNFFAQQTYQTIGVAMQTRRDKAKKAINDRLEDEEKDYPLAAAKRDLVAYFYAGTLPGGLQELQEEANTAAQENAKSPKAALH